jgi:hypothetical protein
MAPELLMGTMQICDLLGKLKYWNFSRKELVDTGLEMRSIITALLDIDYDQIFAKYWAAPIVGSVPFDPQCIFALLLGFYCAYSIWERIG